MYSHLNPVASPASNEFSEETPRLTKTSSLSDFAVRLKTLMPEVWNRDDEVDGSDFLVEVVGLLIESGHIVVEELPDLLDDCSAEMAEFAEDCSEELPEFTEDFSDETPEVPEVCSDELPEFVEHLPKIIDRPYTIGAIGNSIGFLLKSITWEHEIGTIGNEPFETNALLITILIAVDGARVPFEFETRRIFAGIVNPTGERKGHIHEMSCTGRKVSAINGKTFITLYGYEYINND